MNLKKEKTFSGAAVIFQHDVLHEGEEIFYGWKYIFRTSVMFERVADLSQLVVIDPKFEKMRCFFFIELNDFSF